VKLSPWGDCCSCKVGKVLLESQDKCSVFFWGGEDNGIVHIGFRSLFDDEVTFGELELL